MTAARGLALAAAERVIDRIHRDAAVVRLLAAGTRASGLTNRDVLVLEIADLTDRGVAADVYLAHLARRQTERRPVVFARHELRKGTGRTSHLAALPFLQLDVVNRRAEGDFRERERIADQDVRIRARRNRRADFQAVRSQDVALLAVGVIEQGDAGRAVRVVLDRRDLGRDAVLLALEVDDPVAALVAPTLMAGRDPAGVVAAALLRQLLGQRLLRLRLRDLLERRDGHEAAARGRRLVLL